MEMKKSMQSKFGKQHFSKKRGMSNAPKLNTCYRCGNQYPSKVAQPKGEPVTNVGKQVILRSAVKPNQNKNSNPEIQEITPNLTAR